MPGLLIIGAGGFGRETARAALDGAYEGPLLGFLDDGAALGGTHIDGVPVLGPISLVHEIADAAVVICTGRPDNYTSRHALVQRLALPAQRYATLVHPRACLASDTRVGPGSVVLAGVVATTAVSIGAHVAMMPSVLLTHDCVVEDFATMTGSVCLAGGVRIGPGAYLGSGSLVRQGLRVGAWSMVGMGSVVLADVPPGRLWFGSPATDHGPSSAAGYGGAE